jgi:CO/xanthine dehydrogenase FAD-binding subunit
MGLYLRPSTLAEALAALADPKLNPPSGSAIDRLTVLAGGTDFFPAQTARRAWLEKAPQNVLDIWGLDELRGIRRGEDGTSFGALTTWTEICDAELPPAFDGLQLAAREVGGRQVQNRGTIAGNICNASPAADGVPPLLALDAKVEIASVRGRRSMPLAEFITGNRRTTLAPDELVTAVHAPRQTPEARSIFLKLGARSYLLISIVSVAVLLEQDADGSIGQAAIAVGACSAVPVRLTELERRLAGAKPDAISHLVEECVSSALAPIDDVRGSAGYRKHAAAVLVTRALHKILNSRVREAA